MKKILAIFFALFTLTIFAHEPILEVIDEHNGYILIKGEYSNGETAEKTPIIIVKDKPYNGTEESFRDKKVLFNGELDDNSELRLPKPKTKKYLVYFDGGIGHVTYEKGPELTKEEMEAWEALFKDENVVKALGNYKDSMYNK